MKEITYDWKTAVTAVADAFCDPKAAATLEEIKANLKVGHPVFVPYPDDSGEWKLELDNKDRLQWYCVVPPRAKKAP